MSEQTTPTTPQGPEQPQRSGRGRGRRWAFVAIVALAAGLTGSLATRALSQHGFGHWHGHGFMRGPIDPVQAEQRADRMIRHAAIELDATTEQQDKLRAIAKATVKDLLPMRDKAQAMRQRAQALLTQPSVDRNAIEAIRGEQMGLADAASKRIAQALGDAAEVLTLEQRRKIDDHLTSWRNRGYWRPWHRG